MSQFEKTLASMRNNPKGWALSDLQKIARRYGFEWDEGKGSHGSFRHKELRDIITIPYNKPIKPYYVKKLLNAIEEIEEQNEYPL